MAAAMASALTRESRATLGADTGYDTRDFVATLRTSRRDPARAAEHYEPRERPINVGQPGTRATP